MNRYFQILLLSLLPLLASCSKSEQDFLSEAKSAKSANNPSAAEKALQQGLMKYPSSNKLSYELASLYRDTKRWDKLENYLHIHSFEQDFWFWKEIASLKFEMSDWELSHQAFLKAGDRGRTFYPPACILYAEYYRNAAAAAAKMGDRQGIQNGLDRIRMTVEDCTNKNARDDVEETIKEVSSWQHFFP